ncbi:MAG: serine acetyltransferase [Bacteroidetes bacterium]|nr:serine acetyltransferase [Bacteroidota bacterium]
MFLKKFSNDLKRYKNYSKKSALILFLTQQGVWSIFVYRINNNIYNSKLPSYIKRIALLIGVFFQKAIEIITGISIPYTAQIGEGLYIGHFGNIIINANSKIGNNCNISQGVTIGVSGRKDQRGVPIIGNNVYIGANAVIVGKIIIGDNCVVGANSLVVDDFENDVTILGVPAKKVSNNNSEGYI